MGLRTWLRLKKTAAIWRLVGRSTRPCPFGLEVLEDRTVPSAFTVTNTLDDGSAGSLRWAIAQTNGDTDPLSTIEFNLAGTGVQTIHAASDLPSIDHPVSLDGYTQPGSHANTNPMGGADPSDNAARLIAIEGSRLTVRAPGSTVRGLLMLDELRLANGDIVVEGNAIIGNGFINIRVQNGANYTIGGNTPAARNIIAGARGGIWIGSMTDSRIQGNYIGLDSTGMASFNSGIGQSAGIFANDADVFSDNLIGGTTSAERNVIAGWEDAQVYVESPETDQPVTGNHIEGNYIGTNALGTGTVVYSPVSPSWQAVGIRDRSGVILTDPLGPGPSGFVDTIACNLIAGVPAGGIEVWSSTQILGNVIGVDADGNPLPNGGDGITTFFSYSTAPTIIQDNIVAHNHGAGMQLSMGYNYDLRAVSDYMIVGNVIRDNDGPGIYVGQITIGARIESNTIAGNGFGTVDVGSGIIDHNGPGIWVLGASLDTVQSTGIQIRRNSIYGNAGLGIDLGETPIQQDRVTPATSYPEWYFDRPNGVGNLNGTNNGQAFPQLTTARAGTQSFVQGTLHSGAGQFFTLDFYANTNVDPSGYGEGEHWLGCLQVQTDANGDATFSGLLAGASCVGQWITATATDAAGNTSEFSFARQAADLGIYGTPGDNSITVNEAASGKVQVVVDGVSKTYAKPGTLYLCGGDGSDSYTINLGTGLPAQVVAADNGASGSDNLIVNGTAGNDIIHKTTGQVTWGAPAAVTIAYDGIENATINGGAGDDSITDPGAHTTVLGGPGNDWIAIDATSAGGVVVDGGEGTNTIVVQLGSLAGTVMVQTSSPTAADSLVVVGAAGDNSITATGSQITEGSQTIAVTAPLASLTLQGGSGATTMTVAGLTVPVESLSLAGGAGDTTIVLADLGTSVGSLAIDGGNPAATNVVQVEGRLPASVAVENIAPVATLLNGFVYEDFNDDGQIDFNENGIAGVHVHLHGTNDLQQTIDLDAITDSAGLYEFRGLRPGSYTVSAALPTGYTPGELTLGTAGGAVANGQFTVGVGSDDAMNYNFGERPASGGGILSGQTAGIGFWNNKKGQSLLKALNGGPSATQLGNWLATTFPNLFGANAGANNLAGKTNAEVAAVFQRLFVAKGMKLEAQVMATALAVYVTNQTLAGTVAADYGFVVTHDGVGIATVNVGTRGAAVGQANGTVMSVLDILLATDALSADSHGLLYRGNSAQRTAANDLYSAINAAGDIG